MPISEPERKFINNCYICGSSMKSTFQKGSYRFWSCPKCCLECIAPQPDDSVLQQIYGKHYYKAWGLSSNESLVRKIKQQTFSMYLSWLAKPHPGDRLLDCGAATGYLVELADQQGWEAYAIELSEFGANACSNILGADHVHQGNVYDAKFNANPDNLFEVIIMIDFIEHLRDPRDLLRWAREHLSKGGHLLLVTPQVGSHSHHLMGTLWTHYKIEHLWYFNKNNLSAFLREMGFTVVLARDAPKNLSLQYIFHQFKIYPHPIITPVFNILDQLLPTLAKKVRITIPLGDMLLIAHV
ncbi:MAG: class I SAM-dependent methyltransferase [Syntrophobacterales bacterium]|jgi:2-polyprenyl-3-methyl-5-hydroxy-6-metoxy-1,4-benzoquinol methylase